MDHITMAFPCLPGGRTELQSSVSSMEVARRAESDPVPTQHGHLHLLYTLWPFPWSPQVSCISYRWETRH